VERVWVSFVEPCRLACLGLDRSFIRIPCCASIRVIVVEALIPGNVVGVNTVNESVHIDKLGNPLTSDPLPLPSSRNADWTALATMKHAVHGYAALTSRHRTN